MKLKNVLGPMRMPFLVLGPACVFLGLSASLWSAGKVNPWYVLLALIGALASHISVNALNEYYDFKSGLDYATQKTPFSGGSGTLPANPQAAPVALTTGLVALAVAALVGLFFVFVQGWQLLPLGLLGLIVIFTYTIWLNRSTLLCLLAPGLGFGTLMVMGTVFALTGQYTWTSFFASLVPFFLVSNLLLLNQFPDVEADRSVGRKNVIIVSGRKAGAWVYAIFMVLTYLSIILGVVLGKMPVFTLLGLGTLILAVPAIRAAFQFSQDIPRLMPALGSNVLVNLVTPVLVGIGFLLGLIGK